VFTPAGPTQQPESAWPAWRDCSIGGMRCCSPAEDIDSLAARRVAPVLAMEVSTRSPAKSHRASEVDPRYGARQSALG